jgi:bifunctional UDP-N-acetylglucosamine pyrophosphorylase / glucosamine-1-phosphate N-acetyltransferase
MSDLAAVVLAAGKSTRFKSKLVKVLHPVAGVPMIRYTLDALAGLGAQRAVLVLGQQADLVRAALADLSSLSLGLDTVVQTEQLGTGHALLQARTLLEGSFGAILCVYGDMPLLSSATLRRLHQRHQESGATITLLTVISPDSMQFGRIVRDGAGRVAAIVEEDQTTPEQRSIRELNVGVYCFDAKWLWPHLADLPVSPRGEYFLTDTVAQAVAEGQIVEAVAVEDLEEVMGVNTRVHLAAVEQVMRQRVRQRLMLGGVTLVDPATVYADATVEVGPDTVIYPNCLLAGSTRIGSDCAIGPGTRVVDSTIGRNCEVVNSVVEGAVVEDGAHVGPFSHLRNGALLRTGVHVGNFAEIKNSTIGAGSHVGHFSYLGDAVLGERVNVGAGTITCNYDGQRKNPTEIGDDVLLGSDTLLVAPVRVGKRARTGAGAVVTHDVPDDALVTGIPARVRERVHGFVRPPVAEAAGSVEQKA